MDATETSRYVRIHVELVLEVSDSAVLTSAAVERIDGDEFMPDEERGQARESVRADEAEAMAYLVDPVDLVAEIPGAELVQASWSSERAAFDPDSADWELGDDID
ncbi:hypothetical protein [Streptomyces sp. NPDC018031]|uniref:hypothetical protein n=1 Tax=Streptomyces sp. NPDC018031 TaxID=3365033 RepID=UPI0037A7CB07